MKRMYWLGVIIFCGVLFAACGNQDTVGIIGGADGPTEIVLQQSGKNDEMQSLRMLRLDGKLYYDSGVVSTEARCGVMDGSLKRGVENGKIPKRDGEANFDCDGYQWGMEPDTIEVLTDQEWVVFRRAEDTSEL